MNREPPTYTSRFTNRYGEKWEFDYFQSKRQGILRGSNVDWQSYNVVDGHARGLVLNDEEIQWLRRAWAEVTIPERQ